MNPFFHKIHIFWIPGNFFWIKCGFLPLWDSRCYSVIVFKHCACSSIYLTFFAIIQWYKSPFARAHFGTIFNEKPVDASQIFFLGKWRHRDLILFLAPFNCLMQCVSSVWRRWCTVFENIQKNLSLPFAKGVEFFGYKSILGYSIMWIEKKKIGFFSRGFCTWKHFQNFDFHRSKKKESLETL